MWITHSFPCHIFDNSATKLDKLLRKIKTFDLQVKYIKGNYLLCLQCENQTEAF